MTVAVIVLIVLLLIIAILYRLVLDFSVHITDNQSDVYLKVKFLFTLISIKLHLRIYYRKGERLELFLIRKNGSRKNIYPNMNKPNTGLQNLIKSLPYKNYRHWINLKNLYTYIKIGTDDACLTVFLCSLLNNIITIFSTALFIQDNPKIKCETVPEFEKNIFILKMSGIIYLHHARIIFKTLKDFTKMKSVSSKGDK